MSGKKVKRLGLILTLCTVYFLVTDLGVIAPAMGVIAQAYPDVSVGTMGYLMTIVSLVTIFSGFLCGVLAGRKMKYKTLLISALLISIIAGVTPFFFGHNMPFSVLLLLRAIFGLGLGFFWPLANTSIIKFFPEEGERAKVLGYGMFSFNIGNIVCLLSGGVLATKGWNYTFLFYGIAIIPLILTIIFYKEPEHEEELKKEKIKIPGIAYYYLFLFLIAMVIAAPFYAYFSIALAESHIGTSALAGSLIAVSTIGGMLVSLLFSRLYKLLNRYIFSVSAFCVAISLMLIYFLINLGNNSIILPLAFCTFLFGIGQTLWTAGMPMAIGSAVPPAAAAASMGLLMAFQNIGSFISTPLIQFVLSVNKSAGTKFIFFFTGTLSAILGFAILLIVISRFKKVQPPGLNRTPSGN